ncbi:lamin tail domain-containing protein [Candidatus Pacebacteria bacterium]|nr:lamin tail domain-containing protein [Candidatus Paceibacterota bacterium]
MRWLLVSSLLLLPTAPLCAAVTINEIAWMGDSDSANDEWIELYNSGTSAVSLEGWTVHDNMNLSIGLTGSIGPGEYAVLERTDDTSAPGSALLIYTGALSNTGAILTLTRSDGAIEDQVSGGENWENTGGDNVTKETAQYTSSGWTTGTPTPAGANVSYRPPAETVQGEDDSVGDSVATIAPVTRRSVPQQKVEEKVSLVLPDHTLTLELTAPTIAYVNQPVQFVMEPTGITESLLQSVKATWNMGDLSVKHGHEVTYSYAYPGKYIVMIDGEFKRHSASMRHEITILPVAFSITHNSAGDLQIHNDAKYEVDISGYSIFAGESIVFPPGSRLLPEATVTIPRSRLKNSGVVWLFDQANAVVASSRGNRKDQSAVEPVSQAVVLSNTVPHVPTSVPAPVTAATVREPVAARRIVQAENTTPEPTPPTAASDSFRFATDLSEPVENPIVATNPSIATTSGVLEVDRLTPVERSTGLAAVAAADAPLSESRLPYLALIGLLGVGVVALFITKLPK